MTEAQWQGCTDPVRMLRVLRFGAAGVLSAWWAKLRGRPELVSRRKLALFARACYCRAGLLAADSSDVPEEWRAPGGTNVSLSSDPEAAMRSSQHDGGNKGDAVGSEQDWSTGRPANAFVAEPTGAHSHDAPHAPIHGVEVSRASQQGRDSERLGGGSYVGTTSPAGAHSHSIAGGDRETHPTNIYLHWLIKFKDA